MNFVVIVGRVGLDPEIKYFESGTVKANFNVAVDRSFGRENKETDWFTIEVWGRQAEFAAEYIKKGTLLSVHGNLEFQRWSDAAGNVRERPVIKATDIRLEGGRREAGQATPGVPVGSGGF